MNQLPQYTNLEIGKLSSIFGNTTNSYKFYWFLAILDSIKENEKALIPMNELALRMVASVWYPLDYYKLSFGKQDSFKEIAKFISAHYQVDNSVNSKSLFEQLNGNLDEKIVKSIQHKVTSTLLIYVPYRFVRPFFSEETQGLKSDKEIKEVIQRQSGNLFSSKKERVIYRFTNDCIEINDVWLEYFKIHQSILRGFIYWHLVRFLQKNNVNTIGLSEKLEKPSERNLKMANKFWKIFLQENPNSECIYSGKPVLLTDVSLDHFIPWSYVAHDQIWNIVPTSKSVNSSKNNKLPSLELHLEKFLKLQYGAFQFHSTKQNLVLLEDYRSLFLGESLEKIAHFSESYFTDFLKKQTIYQIETAKNMGFMSF
jgi:5-methylcytosine-specific restriction endonuclease McrA